jgi:(p)ppGpp synthase/HD superfamily hydrolase
MESCRRVQFPVGWISLNRKSAFELASGLHNAQTRKGTPVPYIGHMAVCSLVLDAGGDEEQAIAALLHDAVEAGNSECCEHCSEHYAPSWHKEEV